METRAKRAKATETATKPRKDASKKPKAKAKRRKPSSSAKDHHRDKPKKPPTAFFYFLYASLYPNPMLLRSCPLPISGWALWWASFQNYHRLDVDLVGRLRGEHNTLRE
ncbi:hypothetical protein GW17_00000238 [Ensete ventricosum]|nr:hypothetical protein GW17_00000238 [Ensete ventricosum]